MKLHTSSPSASSPRGQFGLTITELMIASTLGVIVLTVVYFLTVFGFRSFAALGNYAELDGTSRAALDRMGREIRQATHVTSVQTNGIVKWLTVVNLDVSPAITNTFTWYSNTALLMWDHWEGSTHTVRTNLTGCDQWDFKMYIRAPNSNGVFVPTGNLQSCKLINMNWRCSRKILGRKMNTETVLTAEVVLRNKRATLP